MNESNLHEYQNVAIQHIFDKTHCGLFLEMGLGKTVSTLTAIKKLIYEELDVLSVLVVAPKRVAENVWTSEIEKWDHLKCLRVSKIIGNPKQRRQAISVAADIYVIGRDNLAWLCSQYGGSSLPFDMLVLDELSSFKNHKAVRFKALRQVQASFKRIVGLTGTPAPNGLLDLWAQIYLLDRGERLERFPGTYKARYFKSPNPYGSVYAKHIPVEGASEKIYAKISDICMSMKAKDYLNLPDRIDNVVDIHLDPVIMKKYEDFEEQQVLELIAKTEEEGDVEISAVNAAALGVKLLQFANGAVYDEEGRYHEVHDLKIEATKDIIEENNGSPVLIAYSFKHDLDRLLKALKKYNPVQLKTDEHIAKWNRGEIQVLIMHPASGGHGLNLQEGGNTVVWFGQTRSLEFEQQFNARLHRQGQKNVVVINKLITKNTIDVSVMQAQQKKDQTQDALLEAVKARIKKYLEKFR